MVPMLMPWIPMAVLLCILPLGVIASRSSTSEPVPRRTGSIRDARIRTRRGFVRWAEALSRALLERQGADGSWRNDATDLREDDPLLAGMNDFDAYDFPTEAIVPLAQWVAHSDADKRVVAVCDVDPKCDLSPEFGFERIGDRLNHRFSHVVLRHTTVDNDLSSQRGSGQTAQADGRSAIRASRSTLARIEAQAMA